MVLARLRTDATRGFLSFTAACAVAIGILAFLSDQALPAAVAGTPIHIDPAFDVPRRVALGLFCLLAAGIIFTGVDLTIEAMFALRIFRKQP